MTCPECEGLDRHAPDCKAVREAEDRYRDETAADEAENSYVARRFGRATRPEERAA